MAASIVKEAEDPLKEQGPVVVEAQRDDTGRGEEGSDWDSDDELYNEHVLAQEDKGYVYKTGAEICTPAESKAFKDLLHRVGVEEFIRETITRGTVSAKKLITAFNIKIPPHLEARPDHECYKLLGIAISRELSKRRRLGTYDTVDDVVKLLKSSENIIVITGAGISTSLGIPDFRSKNTGFYAKLRQDGWEKPEDIFQIDNFDHDPTTFYKLAGDILPDTTRWTPTHQFIRMLQDKGKLLRNYTQNIDNIEANAGILPSKLVQCHGSWATVTCRRCKTQQPGGEGSKLFQYVKRKEVMKCDSCKAERSDVRPGMKRKRSREGYKRRKVYSEDDTDSGGEYDIFEPGVMKPDITFFGEQLPADFFDKIRDEDRFKVDLVIVIGTSMKVAPVSEIPAFLPEGTPQVYISRDEIHHIDFDVNLLGYSDVVVAELCRRAGWELKHAMVPDGQEVVVTTSEDSAWTHAFETKG